MPDRLDAHGPFPAVRTTEPSERAKTRNVRRRSYKRSGKRCWRGPSAVSQSPPEPEKGFAAWSGQRRSGIVHLSRFQKLQADSGPGASGRAQEEASEAVIQQEQGGANAMASNSARQSPVMVPPIFRHACGLELEGIVSKRIGSRYMSGRTRAWLKTKNLDFERP